ncbi:hypothetical protein Scep_011023 [Stephania cephalantha]|uniref:Phospholipase A(1) LCAT3 n=1 Tax=Stephania cephalantha TaxID=152367 RepID=A0AAP0JWA3_9MAGN
MLGDCCFRRRRRVSDEALDPVLLVSGIGGSILNSRNKNSKWEIRVWVRLFLADLEFRKKAWSIYNPKSGYTECLDKNSEVVVPEDDYGLYAIDILDPSWFVKLFHLSEVYHFHDMIDMLVGCGYKKGTTLFGYGFDFRQSNSSLIALDSTMNCYVLLQLEYTKTAYDEMVLQSQLQVAYHVGRIDKAMDGLKVKLSTAYKASGGRKLIECPSIYEMLPNPTFTWKKQPQIHVWRKQPEGEEKTSPVKVESYGPNDSFALFAEALKNNELNYNGNTVPLPFNFSILKWAIGTRQVLENARLPDGVKFYNIYGTSHNTPFDVCYGSEASPIKDLPQICRTMPVYTYVDGDGTVPAESVKADGFAATARVGVCASHRGLLRDKTVFKHIQQWLEITPENSQLKKTSKVIDDM